MEAGPAPGPGGGGGGPGPGPWGRRRRGPGRYFWPRELLREPRAEQNAKNQAIRPFISRKYYQIAENNIHDTSKVLILRIVEISETISFIRFSILFGLMILSNVNILKA